MPTVAMKDGRTNSDVEQGLLDPPSAAAILGLSVHTLKDWRIHGIGPRFIRISSRRVRYRPRDIEAWIGSREEGRNA